MITKPQNKSDKSSIKKHSHSNRISWAERLKRVFKIDIEVCRKCGAMVKIIAWIKDPLVIDQILTHLDLIADVIPPAFQLPEAQGPPQKCLYTLSI